MISFATASSTGAFTPSTNNTHYDITGATTSYDRRIYGINVTNTFGTAETITVLLNDGTYRRQLFQLSVAASSGNSTSVGSVDLLGSSLGAPIFQKQKDANGVPYFNLPTGWSVSISYGTTLTGASSLTFLTFGETYE
jgi:hypothetical protein